MVKRYANMAVVYAVIAMIFGVFYREFTKFNHFTGQTNLSVMHTHYFLLGMFFFLMLMLAEKVFSFSDQKTGKLLIAYQLAWSEHHRPWFSYERIDAGVGNNVK